MLEEQEFRNDLEHWKGLQKPKCIKNYIEVTPKSMQGGLIANKTRQLTDISYRLAPLLLRHPEAREQRMLLFEFQWF